MRRYIERDIREIITRLGTQACQHLEGTTILLCGGRGFLGRYFVAVFSALNEQMLTRPCRLVVVDNEITSGALGRERMTVQGCHFLKHDIIKPLSIDEPIDYIIHAAGIASPYYYRRYPLETLEVATIGTKNLLALGRKQGLKGFLFFSSSEIYGDPNSTHVPTPESYRGNVSCLGPRACYDESKRLGETLCMVFHRLYGVPVKIVRPFNVYGPGMQETDYRVIPNFASRIMDGQPLMLYGTGKQTRTFCYVTDAIVGFIKVLVHGTPGEVYNIGSVGPEISMRELAVILSRVVGKRLAHRIIEHPASYPADEPQRRCPDIRKAREELGYESAVGLDEGLRRFMEWAGEHYAGEQPARSTRQVRRAAVASK